MNIHIVKRDNCPLWKKCCFYVGAVVIALLLGGLLLLSLGVDPVAYYTRMFTMGTIGNKIAYKVWINYLKDQLSEGTGALGADLRRAVPGL